MNEWIVPAISGLFLLGGAFLAFLGTRGKTQTDAKVALEARLDQRMSDEIARLDGRIDDLKDELKTKSRALSAATRIIRTLVMLWPGAPYPRLSSADVDALDDHTIPSAWRE